MFTCSRKSSCTAFSRCEKVGNGAIKEETIIKNYVFYHVYPLGFLKKEEGCRNLGYLKGFIPYWKELSINALYIGPLFESKNHGYDTIDYFRVDRRLGDNEDFRNLVSECHENGMDVVADCVFIHVSRDFHAFVDVLQNRENSPYREWFKIDFTKDNNHGDRLSYETWAGHEELVKLNLKNPEVRDYLMKAAGFWIDAFDIDGLRLDAADVMDRGFIRELSGFCKGKKEGFFVMGEMVHGDYARMIDEAAIDSVTDYECYKGLYSSLNDENYFEIEYSLNRLFEETGLLKGRLLYNFADNHDVDRVASAVKEKRLLYPLYILLYTMNGYPSVYYKSEIGAEGKRSNHTDRELRPPYTTEELESGKNGGLYRTLAALGKIRKNNEVLLNGSYRTVYKNHHTLIFFRETGGDRVIVFLNSENEEVFVTPEMTKLSGKGWDLLNDEEVDLGKPVRLYPSWGRIVKSEKRF